jgi:hypothetical protein
MGGDGKMQYAAPLVRQDKEDIKDLKADRRHGKEVDRNHAFGVVLQERPPRL